MSIQSILLSPPSPKSLKHTVQHSGYPKTKHSIYVLASSPGSIQFFLMYASPPFQCATLKNWETGALGLRLPWHYACIYMYSRYKMAFFTHMSALVVTVLPEKRETISGALYASVVNRAISSSHWLAPKVSGCMGRTVQLP